MRIVYIAFSGFPHKICKKKKNSALWTGAVKCVLASYWYVLNWKLRALSLSELCKENKTMHIFTVRSVLSSGISSQAVRWKSFDILDGHVASNFRVEGPLWSRYKQVRASTCYILHAGFLLGPFVNPEDGGDVPPKCLLTFARLHRVASQKMELLITTTENLKYFIFIIDYVWYSNWSWNDGVMCMVNCCKLVLLKLVMWRNVLLLQRISFHSILVRYSRRVPLSLFTVIMVVSWNQIILLKDYWWVLKLCSTITHKVRNM